MSLEEEVELLECNDVLQEVSCAKEGRKQVATGIRRAKKERRMTKDLIVLFYFYFYATWVCKSSVLDLRISYKDCYRSYYSVLNKPSTLSLVE